MSEVRGRRSENRGQRTEVGKILLRYGYPPGVPCFEVAEFDAEEGGLEYDEAGVGANHYRTL
jgi:hypothetical protein